MLRHWLLWGTTTLRLRRSFQVRLRRTLQRPPRFVVECLASFSSVLSKAMWLCEHSWLGTSMSTPPVTRRLWMMRPGQWCRPLDFDWQRATTSPGNELP